ncbi:triple tyrosine motif-containing protein [Ekhidna sp.]|uniref:triple tyrosine motif-containing protein n=1 Tax=Ekhidna sp. TaxID=2608089 RepID=UPI003510DB61
MCRLTWIIVLLGSALNISAQKGDFLLTHHYPRNSNLDNSNFAISHDSYGRICIANRSGILKYDGEAWDFYKTPAAALSLAIDSANTVYVGCIGGVGLIDFQKRSIGYRPLVELDTLHDLFFQTHHLRNKIYFLSTHHLIVYDIKSGEIKQHKGDYSNIYELDAEMFVNTLDDKTYLINDSLTIINPIKKVKYTDSRKDQPDLILAENDSIYLYKDFDYQPLPQNKQLYNIGFTLSEIQWLNDSLFVCSTIERGLALLNINDPNYIEVTNFNAGLPDNEVYTIHADNSNGIWVAHQFGITNVTPLFPAYSYSHFPGLHGNLTSVHTYNDDLWITTSLGLFYFTEDTIFENKVYYQRIAGSKPQQIEEQEEPDKKKRGFFKAITSIFKDEKNVEKVQGQENSAKYVRRTKKVPIEINYKFEQVEGANGKFFSAFPYRDEILAVGTIGIYEIRDYKAEMIIPERVRSYMVNDLDQLILSTADFEIKVYKLIGDIWVEEISEQFEDLIVSMRQDKDGNMWMAGTTSVYKTISTDTSFTVLKEYRLNNTHLDDVNILQRNETPYFINAQGFFYYDSVDDKVKEDLELERQIGSPLHHLFDPVENSVWVFNGQKWYHLKEDGTIETMEYMGVFQDLRAISLDKSSGHLWLLTPDNDLLKYDPTKSGILNNNPFFLRRVSNEKGDINQKEKFTLEYDENYLNIQLSKPDFLGLSNPEFQYKLEGLHSEWSDWTNSKSIDYSFLPEGDYKLLVRSRDAFGRMEEGEVLAFTVKPPYWQTPWFYAIQIIFFGGLVYLSTKLNQDSSKNRLLRSGLTLLTLVLIIEFLQSAIGSLFNFKSTPVVDFLLDASIAFMIFPLERLLRELMTKGKVQIKKKNIPLVRKDSSSE